MKKALFFIIFIASSFFISLLSSGVFQQYVGIHKSSYLPVTDILILGSSLIIFVILSIFLYGRLFKNQNIKNILTPIPRSLFVVIFALIIYQYLLFSFFRGIVLYGFWFWFFQIIFPTSLLLFYRKNRNIEKTTQNTLVGIISLLLLNLFFMQVVYVKGIYLIQKNFIESNQEECGNNWCGYDGEIDLDARKNKN